MGTSGKINGRIFTSAIHPEPSGGWFNKSGGILIDYKHKEEQDKEKEELHCMSWDFDALSATSSRGAWSEVGCEVDKTDIEGGTRCICKHMTTYAVVLKPLPDPVEDPHEMPLKIITYIGIIVSIVTLVVFTFRVIGFKQRRRDIPHILKNLVVCMIFLCLFVAISE